MNRDFFSATLDVHGRLLLSDAQLAAVEADLNKVTAGGVSGNALCLNSTTCNGTTNSGCVNYDTCGSTLDFGCKTRSGPMPQ